MYKFLYKNIFSKFDPEIAHDFGIGCLEYLNKNKWLCNLLSRMVPKDERLNTRIGNIELPNPIGMAAGFDKNGTVTDALTCLGFGHVEVGTATKHSRIGNSKPRIWRHKGGLRNYMGLPNVGIENIFANSRGVTGLSISSIDCLNLNDLFGLWQQAQIKFFDYITLNISCPNIKHFKPVFKSPVCLGLDPLLDKLHHFNAPGHTTPLFVKFGLFNSAKKYCKRIEKCRGTYQLNADVLKENIDYALDHGASGLVLCNTAPSYKHKCGGISGKFLKKWALKATRIAFKYTDGKVPIISVGGIETAEDVLCFIKNGASAVQLLTSFVYNGPRLPNYILNELIKDANKNGWKSISNLVGYWI